jgi:hypothetical protein
MSEPETRKSDRFGYKPGDVKVNPPPRKKSAPKKKPKK